MTKNKVGIMGGTFDPPHLGHLLSAEYTAAELKLERVIFIPTGLKAYKSADNAASAADRYAMTAAATAANERFDVSDIEIKNTDINYTGDTLEKLHGIYPGAHFYFIVGADSLDYMDEWHEPEKLFRLCTVAAVGRPGFDTTRIFDKAESLKRRFGADIRYVDMPQIDISSTEIKNRIRAGKSIRYMVPGCVEEYIKRNQLYLK
ncbi:MAG: nicotinate-nucleotide adenylyltransferase [Clostridia bacterium]|nr:nicotinate-nucleotide adenylyltransferase [Clostridia bacterium]